MKKDLNTWYEIVFNNWSQIAVILGVIGIILQKFIDLRIRKKEISFSKIQEEKILEVKLFYKSYQALAIALKYFNDQTLFGEHSETIFLDLRKTIRKCFIDFEYNCMTVKLFIEKNEINTIEEISNILESIRIDIEKWHIYDKSKNRPEGWDKLDEIKNERFLKVLPNLIKRIETSLRKSYNA